MILFFTPVVYFLGVHGTSLAISLLSIGFLAVTLVLLHRGLGFQLTAGQKILVSSLAIGWAPMFWVLRAGQSGALLSGLIVIGWYCIRQRRPVWGGIAVGIATSLKIIPGLLLVYFFLRHRRAFFSGVATIVVLNVLAAAFFGVQYFADYVHTARLLVHKDGGSVDSCSLLAILHHLSRDLGVGFLNSRKLFLGLSLAIVGALSGMVLLKSTPNSFVARYDAEYSLFVAAIPLLSPICWQHYFVLLLLPLAVLASVVIAQNATARNVGAFFALCIALAVPGDFMDRMVPFVARHVSWRLSCLLPWLPSIAIVGIVIWIASLLRGMPEKERVVSLSLGTSLCTTR